MKLIIGNRTLKRVLLVSLLLASGFVYVISKEQRLLNEFKVYLESEVAQALSRDVSIREIRGGIITPIIARDVKVAYSENRSQELLLNIREIEVNKRIWDLPFIKTRTPQPLVMHVRGANLYVFGNIGPKIENQEGQIVLDRNEGILTIDLSNEYYNFIGRASDIYKKPQLNLKLKIDSSIASGNISIAGDYDFPNVEADLDLFGLKSASFNNFIKISEGKILFNNLIIQEQYLVQGEIDINKKEALFIVALDGDEKIKFTLSSPDVDKHKGLLEISHLKIKDSDLDGSLVTNISVNRKDSGVVESIKADLRTNTLILDYQPASDIYGNFYNESDKLIINYLNIGDNLKIKGSIGLSEPKEIDLSVELNNLDSEILKNYSFAPPDFNFSAVADCKIDIKGKLPNPYIKVHFITGPGCVDDINFESIRVTIEGEYPLLYFHDSRINREIGHLVIEGKLDMRKLKNGGFFDDMVIKSDKETIIWEGWDITKKKMDNEVTLRRAISDDISVWYKSYLKDETKSEESSKDTIELEYEIFDNKSLKMKLNKEEEFFGVENKIKF